MSHPSFVSGKCVVEWNGHGQAPEYQSDGAAGADLRAAERVAIAPGGVAAVGTGVRVAVPPGFVGLVWPRSGLALRHGIDTLAGVIDCDYRGEVRVVLANHGGVPFEIEVGDRVAQLLIQPVARGDFLRVETLPPTGRSESGFGSTGR
jgi:dUTP pyrophosphatase